MRKLVVCLLLFLFASPHASAQSGDQALLERVDDLVLNARIAEALELIGRDAGDPPSLMISNKKAEVLIRLGDFESAENILGEIQQRLSLQPNAIIGAIMQTNLGFLQLNMGRQDLAEESLQRALNTLEESATEHPGELANALSTLGLVYVSQGKYTQAQEQLYRALGIRQTLKKHRDAWVAATYNDLGLAFSQTDKDQALDYYKQARDMYVTLYGQKDPRIAISNINTGIVYRDLGLHEDAIANFEKALQIWSGVYADSHPAKAMALYNLGQAYLGLHDQKMAADYYTQALKMYKDAYGPKHPEISSVLNALGNLYIEQGKFEEGFRAYQDALKANVPDFNSDDIGVNPGHTQYYNGSVLLHTLLFKAQAFDAKYTRQSLKFADLKEALQILIACDSLIDRLRHESTNESDKLLLGVMANEVYADGVKIAYQAGLNAVRKDAYFEQAFYFAEKSKSAVLLEAIADANAKSYAGIPPALLDEEKSLRSALTVAARKLADKPSGNEERTLRETSFNLKRQYDAFTAKLETEYPSYFNLKYNARTPTVSELQRLLPEETAIISYFIDDRNSQIYIFLVRDGQYKVWQRPLTSQFDKYITGLRNGLYFHEINTLKSCAYQLGRTLIPHLPPSVTDLVVLPTGRLALIPFETLLTDDGARINDYASLPFLLKHYSIRYEFSATLLTQKAQKETTSGSANILLCAPVRFPNQPSLSELPATEREVNEISALFAGTNLQPSVLTGEGAHEGRIKSGRLSDFRYLHFATHGVVDELQPELSRIYLMKNGEDDGMLFAGEIYNLELNANLVTLSACQTGLGKVFKGEGVIGLSRALVYAGARNIIVSFWNVADESTAIMMSAFYKNVLQSKNMDHSRALRDSKLRLLSDERYAAPFYWAPFVLIGF